MARTIRRCPCAAPGDCKGDTHLNQDRKAAARKEANGNNGLAALDVQPNR